MSFRFITKSIHAYLIDYPVAIILITAPFVLKLGQSGPVAMWLSVVVGVAALLLAALTDHPTGLVRIIPYWLHLWVDPSNHLQKRGRQNTALSMRCRLTCRRVADPASRRLLRQSQRCPPRGLPVLRRR
jgi:hypothetical protein